MITKWATSIANKLAELSGEDVSADQLEIYIYGLECFLNTFITIVLLFVWGVLSHTLGYTLIWVITFSLLRHYTGGAHAPTQLTCILGSFFLGCLDKWAIIYLKPTVLGYLILYRFLRTRPAVGRWSLLRSISMARAMGRRAKW